MISQERVIDFMYKLAIIILITYGKCIKEKMVKL